MSVHIEVDIALTGSTGTRMVESKATITEIKARVIIIRNSCF